MVWQVTNLIEDHEYYFRVFALNAAGPCEQPAELKPPVKARLPFGKSQEILQHCRPTFIHFISHCYPFGERFSNNVVFQLLQRKITFFGTLGSLSLPGIIRKPTHHDHSTGLSPQTGIVV